MIKSFEKIVALESIRIRYKLAATFCTAIICAYLIVSPTLANTNGPDRLIIVEHDNSTVGDILGDSTESGEVASPSPSPSPIDVALQKETINQLFEEEQKYSTLAKLHQEEVADLLELETYLKEKKENRYPHRPFAEAEKKYGKWSLTGETLVHKDVFEQIVALYRKDDYKEVTKWFFDLADMYGIRAEIILCPFVIHESSLGTAGTGNNIGSIRHHERDKNGAFRTYNTLYDGLRAVFSQIYLYDNVWTKRGHSIHTMQQALHVYAPPAENDTVGRIKSAEDEITQWRTISEFYTSGKINQKQMKKLVAFTRANRGLGPVSSEQLLKMAK